MIRFIFDHDQIYFWLSWQCTPDMHPLLWSRWVGSNWSQSSHNLRPNRSLFCWKFWFSKQRLWFIKICYLMIFWKQGMIIFQIGNGEVSFLYSIIYVIFIWEVSFLFYFIFHIFMRPVSGGNKTQSSKFVISYLCLKIIMIIMIDYLWQMMVTMITTIYYEKYVINNHQHENDTNHDGLSLQNNNHDGLSW